MMTEGVSILSPGVLMTGAMPGDDRGCFNPLPWGVDDWSHALG